jgi:hypothetical protein
MSSDSVIWVEFKDDEGEMYYFQPTTGVNTRDRPNDPGVRMVSESLYLAGKVEVSIAPAVVTLRSGAALVDDWIQFFDDTGVP